MPPQSQCLFGFQCAFQWHFWLAICPLVIPRNPKEDRAYSSPGKSQNTRSLPCSKTSAHRTCSPASAQLQTFGDTESLVLIIICTVLQCWLGSGARDVSRGEALLPPIRMARSHPVVQCRAWGIWGPQHCGAGGAGPLATAPHCPALICATNSHELPLDPLAGLGEKEIHPEGSVAPEAPAGCSAFLFCVKYTGSQGQNTPRLGALVKSPTLSRMTRSPPARTET